MTMMWWQGMRRVRNKDHMMMNSWIVFWRNIWEDSPVRIRRIIMMIVMIMMCGGSSVRRLEKKSKLICCFVCISGFIVMKRGNDDFKSTFCKKSTFDGITFWRKDSPFCNIIISTLRGTNDGKGMMDHRLSDWVYFSHFMFLLMGWGGKSTI